MKHLPLYAAGKKLLFGALLFLIGFISHYTKGAGVTVITHGLEGNAAGWVTGMANQIHSYYKFPGTNYTFYELYFVPNGSGYNLAWSRLGGSPPSATDSGEIIVAFDWSQLSDGNSYNTYPIASVLDAALLSTNFISELNGHALCELPIHLIGHSRGGSVMCQTSLLLGTNGVWVDHLTTLDPHPLNNDGFDLDFLAGYFAVDAPCATYQNILFHDNCWENIGLFVYGEPVSGAYVRQLYNVSGGYENIGDEHYPHSNVHLWYHGSIDFDNPASDTEASITTTERNNWWVSYEDYGIISGFYYSLIGGGNRTSNDHPAGQGYTVSNGYNQDWDLGAGQSQTGNRTALTSNNGNWPNVMKFDLISTNQIQQGSNAVFSLYFQWAQPSGSTATVSLYLDDDFNPYNGNSHLVKQVNVSGTGTSGTSISLWNSSNPLTVGLNATNAPVGYHALYAQITGGGRTRYLYAPQWVQIISNRQQPVLDIAKLNSTQFRIGVNGVSGQTIAIQVSTNLQTWLPLTTNTLTGSRWNYTNSLPANKQFYRALLSP